MLFDLTGRGRRKTVKVIYSGLAALFLVGFVGFGVGSIGGGGGGLAEIFGEGNSGGEASYQKQLKQARLLTVREPNNPGAWSGLVHYAVLEAGTGKNYIRTTTEEGFGPKAQPLLKEIQAAWQHYLKLNPHHPNPELAAEVLRIYSTPGGLANPTEALRLLKIKIASQPPSATLQYDLATAAYAAKRVAEGDKAAKKAVALAPAGERTILQNYLAKAKSQASGKTTSTQAAGGQTVSIPASQLPKGAKSGATVTIPASQLPKGAKSGATVTIPASQLPKGFKGATTPAPANGTTPAAGAPATTAPASTTTAPKK